MRQHQVEAAPVVIVPYVWIGDFVRGHSVVTLLRGEAPERPVDMVASTLCAPLADYMPGVRASIVADLPRGRIGWAQQNALAAKLRAGGYGQALIMSRKWKAALAPWLAGIPQRTGFAGEARFGLINDMRWREKRRPRMIDRMGALALPVDARPPGEWPKPELKVPAREVDAWCTKRGLAADDPPIVTLSPGAVGEGKAWPPEQYADLARALLKEGRSVWILGGPGEATLAAQIVEATGGRARNLTGKDLRDAILALAAADVSVTNDSGLMHVSAAIGVPTVAIFGPTSPWHQQPLNPLAAIIEPPGDEAARQRARHEGNDAVRHRSTADVTVASVLDAVRRALP
jgi:lipopolysaccharide heptosyltransferase II